MQIGMIGLGRMGSAMTRRLLNGGHHCVIFDLNRQAVSQLAAQGAVGADSLEALAGKLNAPRAVWVMLPAGEPTEKTVCALSAILSPGDVIVDGGNSYYKDDVRRAAALRQKNIQYVDVGTSGGVWGEERGYCLMYGGETDIVRQLEPVFKTLAPGRQSVSLNPARRQTAGSGEAGYLHCGPVGSGHYVKMVHNGIEYGLMQAYAEGFDILRSAADASVPEALRYQLKLDDIAELWRRGSVVSSWLLDLAAMALAEDAELAEFSGVVQDSGEGRWTIQAAIEQGVPADVLSAALFARFRSRQEHTFAEKLLSAMRKKFGGHLEKQHTGGVTGM